MSTNKAEVNVQINNSPEAVIEYVSDVNNRPLYLPSLESVSDVEGEATAVGTTWRWKWVLLGVEFEGTGRCVEYEAGGSYSFTTEGGIDSKFTYQAEPADEGASLSIRVEFDIPDTLLSRVGIGNLIESAKQRETEQVANNLKTILDQ